MSKEMSITASVAPFKNQPAADESGKGVAYVRVYLDNAVCLFATLRQSVKTNEDGTKSLPKLYVQFADGVTPLSPEIAKEITQVAVAEFQKALSNNEVQKFEKAENPQLPFIKMNGYNPETKEGKMVIGNTIAVTYHAEVTNNGNVRFTMPKHFTGQDAVHAIDSMTFQSMYDKIKTAVLDKTQVAEKGAEKGFSLNEISAAVNKTMAEDPKYSNQAPTPAKSSNEISR